MCYLAFEYVDSTTPPTIMSEPRISDQVIGLNSIISPIIIATNGSKFESIEALEASTYRMF